MALTLSIATCGPMQTTTTAVHSDRPGRCLWRRSRRTDPNYTRRIARLGGGRRLCGSAVGAVAGSLIDQQRAVQQAISDPNVNVTNDRTNVTVVFPNSVLFDTVSAPLSPISQRDIMRLAGFLQLQPARSVVVIDHTDSTGSLTYHQTLSKHRARVV